MHSEHYEIPADTADIINQAKTQGRRIIAVGTTSVRTLEAAASNEGRIRAGSGETNIFIYPGYTFKMVDGAGHEFSPAQVFADYACFRFYGAESCA